MAPEANANAYAIETFVMCECRITVTFGSVIALTSTHSERNRDCGHNQIFVERCNELRSVIALH